MTCASPASVSLACAVTVKPPLKMLPVMKVDEQLLVLVDALNANTLNDVRRETVCALRDGILVPKEGLERLSQLPLTLLPFDEGAGYPPFHGGG